MQKPIVLSLVCAQKFQPLSDNILSHMIAVEPAVSPPASSPRASPPRASPPAHLGGLADLLAEWRANPIERFQQMSATISGLDAPSALMPSSYVKKPIALEGMTRVILLQNSSITRQVSALCRTVGVVPPTKHMRETEFHFAKEKNKKVVAYICYSMLNLNRIPGSVALYIHIVASTDKEHAVSIALNGLIKTLQKRRMQCVVFTQVANTEVARNFWCGKLTATKRATLVVALCALFDPHFVVYEDASDMALFC